MPAQSPPASGGARVQTQAVLPRHLYVSSTFHAIPPNLHVLSSFKAQLISPLLCRASFQLPLERILPLAQALCYFIAESCLLSHSSSGRQSPGKHGCANLLVVPCSTAPLSPLTQRHKAGAQSVLLNHICQGKAAAHPDRGDSHQGYDLCVRLTQPPVNLLLAGF